MKLLKKYDFRKYNYMMVLIIISIAVFGVLMVYSASDMKEGIKQGVGVILGVITMLFISLIDYNFIAKFYWLIHGFNIFLLLLVRIYGANYNNAVRWIEIPLPGFEVSIQPSEFCKIFIIIFIAKFLTVHREKISSFRFLFIFLAIVAVPLFLIFKQPDLSTTLLLSVVIIMMVYCAGLKYKNIIIILLCVIPVVVTGIIYIQSPDQKLLAQYQVNRIMSFIDPDKYDDLRYQQDYSVRAIASGQLYGKGFNNEEVGSIKNLGYISEAESDFIFAVIGEELGFIGSCFLIFLLAFLVFECILISIYAKDFTGRLICCGYACLIAVSTFLNIGVATELLPNTGLPLPFVSSGLSSMISLFAGAGILLNISLQRNKAII